MRDNGDIDLDGLRRCAPAVADEYKRAQLAAGDIILAIVGTIGKVAVTPDVLAGGNITQSSARIRPAAPLTSDYIAAALRSPLVRRQFAKFEFGNAVRRLNIAHVRQLAVPIAPASEQPIVALRASTALARGSVTERRFADIAARLNDLDAAILAAAFRGELVPRDSSSPDLLATGT